jgi:hypothetical protein
LDRRIVFIFVLIYLSATFTCLPSSWASDYLTATYKSEGVNGYYPKILVNQSVNYTIYASGGTPPYKYQWYIQLNTQRISDERIEPVSNSSKFTLTPTHAGTFLFYYAVTDPLNATAGTAGPLALFRLGAAIPLYVFEETASPSASSSPSPSRSPIPSPTPQPTLSSSPSVPEFTAKLISSSPENQSVNTTIELSIKNQPFIPNYGFFYNIRMSVNDGDWSLLYPNNNSVPTQSNGDYTTLSYPSGHLGVENQYNLGYKAQNLFAGDKVDFQVQAMIGEIQRVFNPNFTSQIDMYLYVFTGESSDWSNTQTITIPASNASPTPTPTVPEVTQSPVQPTSHAGLPSWVYGAFVVLALVIVGLVGVIVLMHKRGAGRAQ